MSRILWAAAAFASIAFLTALALTGGRSGPGNVPFTPGGLLLMSPADVREVDVTSRAGRWRFVRAEGGWRVTQGSAPAGFEVRLDAALTLLRNSGPERTLSKDEIAGVDVLQFGLEVPRVRVVVTSADAKTFAISFGAANLLGLSHFARVDGHREIALIPGFVAEAWEHVGGAP